MFAFHMSQARIEGNIFRILSKARATLCFEGSGLRKTGTGSRVQFDFGNAHYCGELIALSPTRVIVHISEPARA